MSSENYSEDFHDKFHIIISNESIDDMDEYFDNNDAYIDMAVSISCEHDGKPGRRMAKKRTVDTIDET